MGSIETLRGELCRRSPRSALHEPIGNVIGLAVPHNSRINDSRQDYVCRCSAVIDVAVIDVSPASESLRGRDSMTRRRPGMGRRLTDLALDQPAES
jgi:hypothetical protein